MKRKYLVALLIAGFGALFHAIAYVNPYAGKILLSELVLQISGSRGKYPLGTNITELTSFLLRMVPYYLFQMYFGIMMFRHFCTASVYVFSRYPNRLHWFYKEVIEIGAVTVVYQGIQCLFVVLITMVRYDVDFDKAGILLLLYHFAIYTLWIGTLTLSVNLLAIKLGSNTAFTAVIVLQIVFVILLRIIFTNIKSYGLKNLCLNINPVSHLILGWQNSKLEDMRQVLNPSYSGLNINVSLIYMIVIFAAVTLTGAYIVRKHDLLANDAEMGV